MDRAPRVAIALLLALKDLRLTVVLPVFIALLFAIAPGTVTKRVMSIFDVQEPTNQDRLAMIEIGARIVKDRPLTGVGPNMIPRVYAEYRPDYAINQVNPHLHNVPLQIAAERGLPALAIWLWFVIALLAAHVRLFRKQADKVPCRRRARGRCRDARRRTLRVQLRRLRVPDALPRARHAAVRGGARR